VQGAVHRVDRQGQPALRQVAALIQTLAERRRHDRDPGEDLRVRLHDAGAGHRRCETTPTQSAIRLLGVEQRGVLEFRPATQRGMDIPVLPGVGLHQRRDKIRVADEQRLQRPQPPAVQILQPGLCRHAVNLTAQRSQILRIVLVGRRPGLVGQDIGVIGAKRGGNIQSKRQRPRLLRRANFRVDQLLHDVAVQREALPEQAEAARELVHLLSGDADRQRQAVDARTGQRRHSRQEGVQPRRIGQRVQRQPIAEGLRRQRPILRRVEVVHRPDQEGQRLGHSLPLIVGAAVEQGTQGQQAGQCVGLTAGLERDPPQPHHRPEVRLQQRAAFVVATGFVLAEVFLQVIQDRYVQPAFRRPDHGHDWLRLGADSWIHHLETG